MDGRGKRAHRSHAWAHSQRGRSGHHGKGGSRYEWAAREARVERDSRWRERQEPPLPGEIQPSGPGRGVKSRPPHPASPRDRARPPPASASRSHARSFPARWGRSNPASPGPGRYLAIRDPPVLPARSIRARPSARPPFGRWNPQAPRARKPGTRRPNWLLAPAPRQVSRANATPRNQSYPKPMESARTPPEPLCQNMVKSAHILERSSYGAHSQIDDCFRLVCRGGEGGMGSIRWRGYERLFTDSRPERERRCLGADTARVGGSHARHGPADPG